MNRYHERARLQQRDSTLGGGMEDVNFPFSKFSWQSKVDPQGLATSRKYHTGGADTLQVCGVKLCW
jgi:hypothetical protein